MIINLTQHDASPAQQDAGVYDLEDGLATYVRDKLTFDALPSEGDILSAAMEIAAIAGMVARDTGATQAMIGGMPALMAPLERALSALGITPVYAFSRRESEEVAQEDGTTRKVSVFRHLGFIPAAGR
jgi:hypothetical protein